MTLFPNPFIQKSCLVLGFSVLSFNMAFAEETKNVKISADRDYLNITWDNISNIDNTDGFALQWNKRQNYVKIDKSANLYRLGKVPGKSLRRASFNNNTYYYLRVYSYTEENNRKTLGNGSKLIKWKVDPSNNIIQEEIVIVDPVIVSNDNSSSSFNALDSLQKFSQIRILALDNFANFGWAKPKKLTKNDYDGYILTISENSTLANPVIDAVIDQNKTEVQIKGLKPNTTYYIGGYFYKRQGGEDKKFGKGSVVKFKTIPAVDRNKYSRASRNIKKLENKAITKIEIEGYEASTSSSNNSNSSTSSTSSSSSSSSSSSVNLSSNKSIEARITAIDNEIRKLRAEKARLELKLGKKSTRSSSVKSSKKLSLRERLKLKREKSGKLSLRERLALKRKLRK